MAGLVQEVLSVGDGMVVEDDVASHRLALPRPCVGACALGEGALRCVSFENELLPGSPGVGHVPCCLVDPRLVGLGNGGEAEGECFRGVLGNDRAARVDIDVRGDDGPYGDQLPETLLSSGICEQLEVADRAPPSWHGGAHAWGGMNPRYIHRNVVGRSVEGFESGSGPCSGVLASPGCGDGHVVEAAWRAVARVVPVGKVALEAVLEGVGSVEVQKAKCSV